MSNRTLLRKLFNAHLADLANVKDILKDGVEDIFICPICLNAFTREDLENSRLTVGHVWPDYVRQKGERGIAKEERVLLCDNCNSTAGSRGDKQMQLHEKVREGEESGDFYGDRLVQIAKGPDFKPIKLNVTVKWDKETNTVKVTGKVDKDGNWVRADPDDQKRFLELFRRKERFSFIVHPYHELKSDLPVAGWITSAYLSAFYRLGYRYILRPELDPVRLFILDSFDKSKAERLAPPDTDNFRIKEYNSAYFPDPVLELVIPLDGNTPIHLQVSCLRYQIKLPVYFVPKVLKAFIYSNNPELYAKLAEVVGNEVYLSTPIECSKIDGHDCIYDLILGKPIELTYDDDENETEKGMII